MPAKPLIQKDRRIGSAGRVPSHSPESIVDPNQLPQLAQTLVAAYYSNDFERALHILTDDCLIITEEGELFASKEDLKRAVGARKSAPSMMVREMQFQLTSPVHNPQLGSNAVVAGTFRLYSSPREQMLHASTQLMTICFSLTCDGWQAFHVHSSSKRSETVSSDQFPMEISRETYDYVRAILRTGSKAGILPSRIMLESGAEAHYLNPDDIVYVHAEGKHCTAHCLDGDYPVNALISEVEEQVPGTFLRVHRSYLVNSAHISGMRRFVLELSDGSEIPIPERRYSEVRREIALRATGGMGI